MRDYWFKNCSPVLLLMNPDRIPVILKDDKVYKNAVLEFFAES